MGYFRAPTLGVDPTRADTSAEFELGTPVEVDGVQYIYVQANGAVATQTAVALSDGWQVATSGNAGLADAVTVVALADNEYGWVAIRGEVTCNVAGSTAAGAALAPVCDANGDLVTVASGVNARRAKALSAESSGLSSVYLY